MAVLFGLAGFVGGVALSIFFIFPENILSKKLAALTLGDILRILAGLGVPLLLAAVAASLGWAIAESREDHQKRGQFDGEIFIPPPSPGERPWWKK